jgi:hypothetical protein
MGDTTRQRMHRCEKGISDIQSILCSWDSASKVVNAGRSKDIDQTKQIFVIILSLLILPTNAYAHTVEYEHGYKTTLNDTLGFPTGFTSSLRFKACGATSKLLNLSNPRSANILLTFFIMAPISLNDMCISLVISLVDLSSL